MDKINSLITFLKGKKTYGVAIVGAILAGLQLYGVTVPDGVWTLLGFAGLGTLRDALNGLKPVATTDSK